MSAWSGTALPAGTCGIHGWHGYVACPKCSSAVKQTLPAPKPLSDCDTIGHHLFKRDHFFGVPVGEPYCMFCGKRGGSEE